MSGEGTSLICGSVVACNVLKTLLKNEKSDRTGQETAAHLSMSQTVEAVMDRQHVVTLDESHPHGRADGSVHTSTGGANVHDGHIDVALVARSEICLI